MGNYKVMNISMPEALFKKIDKVAKEENRTRSELVREALRQYLDNIEWRKIQRYAQAKAKEMGIKNEADIERLIHEYREQNR